MQNALRINSTDITVANEKLKIWRRGLEAEKDGDLAEDAKQLLDELVSLANDSVAIADRFYSDIDFGTAGLRGLMGAGSAAINAFTVRHATKALAEYICRIGKNEQGEATVAISYDTRNNSRRFADIAAKTLNANGIDVLIFDEASPVPELAFATARHNCDMGIMITASHNPGEYNGYKLYTKESGQIGDAAAHEIASIMRAHEIFDVSYIADFNKELTPEHLKAATQTIPKSTREAYIEAVLNAQFDECRPDKNANSTAALNAKTPLGIVYTPLNGTGAKPLIQVLQRLGFAPHIVKEQAEPDGDFSTCSYPNPEKIEALELAIGTAHSMQKSGEQIDMVIATDPDSDRLGVVEIFGKDGYRKFTGNEVGILLFDFICHMREKQAHERRTSAKCEKPIAYKSIVTTDMIDLIAKKYGVSVVETLTGFKYAGGYMIELQRQNRMDEFVFAMEESCGYLVGGYVFDKDGVSAAAMAACMTRYWKSHGISLSGRLEEIYSENGTVLEDTQNFMFYGQDGMEKMRDIMAVLRKEPPHEILGQKVTISIDYKSQIQRISGGLKSCCMVAGTKPTGLPPANAVRFVLADDSEITIRPSGTEPKLKVYISAYADRIGSIAEQRRKTLDKIEHLKLWMEDSIKQSTSRCRRSRA